MDLEPREAPRTSSSTCVVCTCTCERALTYQCNAQSLEFVKSIIRALLNARVISMRSDHSHGTSNSHEHTVISLSFKTTQSCHVPEKRTRRDRLGAGKTSELLIMFI